MSNLDARGRPHRKCAFIGGAGVPCRANPLREKAYCRFHDPDSAEAVAAARHEGGLRRRREAHVPAVDDLDDLPTPRGLWRLLEISVRRLLELPNSVARDRTLLTAVTVGARLLETTDVKARLSALEFAQSSATDPASNDWIEGSVLNEEPDWDGPAR